MLLITAPAKINLALDVRYRRPDGYHEVDMIMQSISLADDILLSNSDRELISCDNSLIPVDEGNIALRAALLLRQYSGFKKGFSIHITKKIPVAAGMAGGSADAAAVLVGLNQLWNLGLSREKLLDLGRQLGADVPFCICKGTYRAQGIGEKLTKINSHLKKPVFLITPNVPLSTAEVYQSLQLEDNVSRPNLGKVIDALEKGDLEQLTAYWGNILETSARKHCPFLEKIYNLFRKNHLGPFLMSGSGPTVFMLDPPRERVIELLKELPLDWFSCYSEMLL